MIDQILTYNAQFVANKEYEPYVTDKFPAKKLAVLTCMDTRLTELLPKALGIRNGDAKIIKNAGGLVLSETDSAIRSLLVGIYELGVQEVMVVHHSTCGACHMSYDEFKPHMLERGISPETLAEWESKGVADWLEGFHDTEASVRRTVDAIVNHPLVPKDMVVRGFIIDSVTGALARKSVRRANPNRARPSSIACGRTPSWNGVRRTAGTRASRVPRSLPCAPPSAARACNPPA